VTTPSDITTLVRRWSEGDTAALHQLMPLVYERMHELAHKRLRSDPDASLNTTALVHEAYLKLVDASRMSVRDHGYFLWIASRVMRYLLVDHARNRKAAKRGLGQAALRIDEDIWIAEEEIEPVLELHEALEQLESVDERRCRILEQRYFGGLSLEETAAASGVSVTTVKRELRSARAWLAVQLQREVP
jgi:RNA polymerase sigma factor (TIGR02999 family)